jgi:hypothetical protein
LLPPVVDVLDTYREKEMENGKKRKKRGDLYDKNMGPLPVVVFFTTPPWPFPSHTPRYPSFICVRIPKERLTKKITAPKTPKSPPEAD